MTGWVALVVWLGFLGILYWDWDVGWPLGELAEPVARDAPWLRGRCLVCRSALETDVVLCRSCRTPHHRECWDYVGSCSVFACRATAWIDILEE